MNKVCKLLLLVFITLICFGYISAVLSLSVCENRVVRVSAIHTSWTLSKIGANFRIIDGESYDYTNSKLIVSRLVDSDTRIRSLLNQRELDIMDQDKQQCSFSRGRVVLPFVVAVDSEVMNSDGSCWGVRSYCFVLLDRVCSVISKVLYTVKTNDFDLNGKRI
jgi:hypothetical protein